MRGSNNGGFARGSNEGGFTRGSNNGGFVRGSNKGEFVRGSNKGGFVRGRNEGGFVRGRNEGGFVRGSNKGGFVGGSSIGRFAGGSNIGRFVGGINAGGFGNVGGIRESQVIRLMNRLAQSAGLRFQLTEGQRSSEESLRDFSGSGSVEISRGNQEASLAGANLGSLNGGGVSVGGNTMSDVGFGDNKSKNIGKYHVTHTVPLVINNPVAQYEAVQVPITKTYPVEHHITVIKKIRVPIITTKRVPIFVTKTISVPVTRNFKHHTPPWRRG